MVRFPTAFLLLVIALCGGLGAYGWNVSAAARAEVRRPSMSGMARLAAFRCPKPERKVVVVRGVEDAFSPAGVEPTYLRPARRTLLTLSMTTGGSYDQSQPDIAFADSIKAPERVVNGLVVMAIRGLVGSENDGMSVGDGPSLEQIRRTGRVFRSLTRDLSTAPGWRFDGAVYSADFRDVRFFTDRPRPAGEPANLLEYLRGGGEWIDVMFSEDTSVDFIGLAFCVAPVSDKGVSFYAPSRNAYGVPGGVILSCNGVRDDRARCDPYVGETSCKTPLPVACIRPGETPAPAAYARMYSGIAWSGGDLAAAPPAPGDRFRTIAEVDAYCAAHLGRGWRTLRMHDGLDGHTIAGRGDPAAFEPRAWIDSPDQPYASCWDDR
ncbi:MAG: hypothetical protein ACOY4K_15905 [Pseudomonadota bacterium]